ncbi:MAG: hypothetical protein ABL858_02495 [Candidatus Nitrotoga sp.]
MHAEKLSISIPASAVDFIEKYRKKHTLKSRSQVIQQALVLLREQDLETAYREAAGQDDDAFEITVADGLNDEAW